MGTQYKIEDYVQAFGLADRLPYYIPLLWAILQGALEFCLGIYLFFGIRRRTTTWLLTVFMVLMTPLTLYLAIASPINDCGCFGDALVLTNWETFGKNIVLLAASFIVLHYAKLLTRFVTERNQWMISMYSLLFIFVLTGYSLYHLPVMDFRPYAIGTSLRSVEEEASDGGDQEDVYIFEKDGERLEATWSHRPDSTWTLVDVRYDGEQINIATQDFQMSLMQPGSPDITADVLADPGYTFLLISPYIEAADDAHIDRINEVYDYCLERGYAFYCLTASDESACERWIELTGAEYPFCFSDAITLKTVIRSNPGLVLLKDGRIVNKWSHNDIPSEYILNGPLDELPLTSPSVADRSTEVLHLLLWFFVPFFVLTLLDRLIVGSKLYKRFKNRHRVVQPIKNVKNMRKKIVAGNWKMNMNLQEGVALATELNEALAADKPNCDVVICTPFIHLAKVADILNAGVIGLGAENCADKEKGAYTGEVSASMVKSTGAQYVILGHSERRAYYGETAEILKEKVNLALANGLKVIFCIGEVLEEREANKQNEVVKAQLEGSLFDLTAEQFANIILAYEPVWAIGTGKTATSDQAEEMHAFIRTTIAEKFGAEAAENVSILYGGSCKPSNAKELFAKPDVDGGLIGGAALKCADFKGIIDAWK